MRWAHSERLSGSDTMWPRLYPSKLRAVKSKRKSNEFRLVDLLSSRVCDYILCEVGRRQRLRKHPALRCIGVRQPEARAVAWVLLISVVQVVGADYFESRYSGNVTTEAS